VNLEPVVGEDIERSLAAIGEGLRSDDSTWCAVPNALGQCLDHASGGEGAFKGIRSKHNLHCVKSSQGFLL
jgi:hypothetical protein